MDLFGALNNAFSGINRTQDALSVVAGNVSGANQPGYVRRQYMGQSGIGVPGNSIQRVLDTYVQKQLWSETSSAGYTGIQSEYIKQLDLSYGDPSSSNTLAAKFDAFSNAMITLQANPGGTGEQTTVLSTAETLAKFINKTSSSIQSLRTSTEDALSQLTIDANNAMATLARINEQVSATSGYPNPSLLDSRDATLNNLSELMDVSPVFASNGILTLTTKSGLTLVNGNSASSLIFNSKSPLTALSVYNLDPASSGTGTLTLSDTNGGKIDLLANGSIRSGKISDLIDLRDIVLPKAQSQLDDLAAGISTALSDKVIAGSATTNGFDVDLNGIQSGNTVHLDYVDTAGQSHHISLVNVTDASKLPLNNSDTADPNDLAIGVNLSAGIASALSSLQSGLDGIGAGLTADIGGTNNTLRITATAPALVKVLSATLTTTALQGQGISLPIFTDSPGGNSYTGSIDGTGQHLGYAARIMVNPGLVANPRALSDYTGSMSATDPTRITALINQLNHNGVTVSAGSGLGLTSGSVSVGALVRQLAQTQANETNRLSNLNDTQSTILNAVQNRFNKSSGVNMDEELTNLTQLQNIFAANAKVLMAVKEMFDVLMRI